MSKYKHHSHVNNITLKFKKATFKKFNMNRQYSHDYDTYGYCIHPRSN